MKKNLLFFAFALIAFFSCQQNLEDKLVGKWCEDGFIVDEFDLQADGTGFEIPDITLGQNPRPISWKIQNDSLTITSELRVLKCKIMEISERKTKKGIITEMHLSGVKTWLSDGKSSAYEYVWLKR